MRRIRSVLFLSVFICSVLVLKAWACYPQYPTIEVSTNSITASAGQGTSPGTQTFTVRNSGYGTLSYTITDYNSDNSQHPDATWLTESPTSGASSGEAKTITLTFTTAGLAVGTYHAVVTVSDSAASNNPQTIAVTLNIYTAQYRPAARMKGNW